MKKHFKSAISLVLTFIMLLQLCTVAIATDSEIETGSDGQQIPAPSLPDEGNYFYLQPDKETISETDTGHVRVKIGRSGDTAEAASVILKLVDISSRYDENYIAYMEGEDVEGVSEFGKVSMVDFAVENEGSTFEQEYFEEEDLAKVLSDAGNGDILDSEGNVVGQLTINSDGSAAENVDDANDESESETLAEFTDETNPLRKSRNQYTGTVSDRQLVDSEDLDFELFGTMQTKEPDASSDALGGELVQDDFPGTEYTLEFSEGENEKYLIIEPKYSKRNDGDSVVMCMLKEASHGVMLHDDNYMKYISITDEDGPANAVISMKADTVVADTGKAYVEISREGAINNTVYANIYTVPGSAETGKDFSGMSAKLYFPMGIKTRLVEIPVKHDDAEKDFYVKIGTPVGCEIENDSTLVRIVREADMNKYSGALISGADLMSDDFQDKTVISEDMIGIPYDLSTAIFYGNTNRQPDDSIVMSGEGQDNNLYNAMQIISPEMGYLYDGLRIKWKLWHKWLVSNGSEVIKHICKENGNTLYKEIYKNVNSEFSRINDYFFGNSNETVGIEIGTVTSSWHGRNLGVYEISPIKREFTFNLLPAKTPAEGGLDFIGCSDDEIAKYQHVIMNSSITDTKCTIKSNESFSVSADGEEFAEFTGIEILADGKAPYFIPVSKNTRTVNIVADAQLINKLGSEGYISFSSNSQLNEKAIKGNIRFRPVFEHIDVNVEFLHSKNGYFEGYETNGSDKLIKDKFHLGDKLTLKAITGDSYVHDYKPMGISYVEKDSKLASVTKSKGTVQYVDGEESRLYTLTDYYTGLKPVFTKKETSTVVVVSKEDMEYFNTDTGLFVMAQSHEDDGNGNIYYYISTGDTIQGYLYLNATTKDDGMVAVWNEEDGENTYSGNTFYVQPDLYKEVNYIYLSVSKNTADNAYFKLSGYADAPDMNLSTGHFADDREYPASDALISICGTGANTDYEGYFNLNPIYAMGSGYVRYLISYNGVSEIKDVRLPVASAPSESVTYDDWNGTAYEKKTVNAVHVELGVITAPTHTSAGVHFDSINVIQGEHYVLGAQILEMNGLETKLSVTVSDGHKYVFEGSAYPEKVTAVNFIFKDALTGEQKSVFPAQREGDTNKWTYSFRQFTPDDPASFSYGDILYVQMQTDKKLFTEDELKEIGNLAPVMTYNPVATGYAVISDTSYEPQTFEMDIPLDPDSIMGDDASLMDETRATYGTFPFIGEIRFAVAVMGYLKATMRNEDYADEMIADLERMQNPGMGDSYIGEGFSLTGNSVSRNTTKKFRYYLSVKIKELPYGGTRMMIGAVGLSGNTTFEKRVNPYENASVAKDMFSRAVRPSIGASNKMKNASKAINSVNSMMGGNAFSFSIYLGLYLDWGYMTITTTHDDNTTSISNDGVFLGGGGFVGGGVTADGMKPFLVPPGIPCYAGYVASATVTDFFGYSANPYRKLKSVQDGSSINTTEYELQNEITATADLSLYGGVGLANIAGVRVSLGAGVELAYSPKMSKWFPHVNKDWGVSLLANAGGQVDLVAVSIPLVSFSFPLYTGGFHEYFTEIRIGNRLIEIVNEGINEIVNKGQAQKYQTAIETARTKIKDLQRVIDNPASTGEEVKSYASSLREHAHDTKLISSAKYYMSFMSSAGGVLASLLEEKDDEPQEGYYVRNHVDSRWVADGDTELFGAYEQMFSEKVVEDSYIQPSSQLIPLDDNRLLMVYIGDDKSRPNIQAATLMYAIYDSVNDKWTDPQILQDDGTADSAPNLCDAGDEIMISWVSTNPDKVPDSENPVDHLESQDIFTVLFNKENGTLGTIEQITDDVFCDAEPQGVYDSTTGDRQVFYVKSAFDEAQTFSNNTDELMSFINPNATYSVICYMLYDNCDGKKQWATDYYYPTELPESNFDSAEEYDEYVATWKGQRVLPTVLDGQSDPLITDLTVCESYDGISVYAYSVDTDNDPNTFDDKELHVQFYDFKNHDIYPPIMVTSDNVCQTQPRLIKNDDSCYLFWIHDNSEIRYIDLSVVVKGIQTDPGVFEPVIKSDGTIEPGYIIDVQTVDAISRYDGTSVESIVDYQVLTDENDNLYVVWTRPVITSLNTDSGSVNDLAPVEVYATAKIREGENVNIDGTEYERGGKWSKPYRLTYTNAINDGVAAALSKDGGIMLMHNQYTMKYVGFDPEYFEDYRIVTREDENGVEQKYLEGQLYEMSPVNLMVTRCAPIGSLEVAEFIFSDEVPVGGDRISVGVTIENTGLTSAKGYIAKFFECRNGQKGEQIAAFESDETVGVNTAFTRGFEWTLPDDIEGLSVLAEITEKKVEGEYIAADFLSEPFTKRSDCELTLNGVKQKGDSFVTSFTVANNGNTKVGEGVKANVHLVGLYGDPVDDYGMENDILASTEITGLDVGEEKDFDLEIKVPDEVFNHSGFDAIEISITNSNDEIIVHSEEEFIQIEGPMNFKLNNGNDLTLSKGSSHELNVSYDGGEFIKIAENIVYSVENPDVAIIKNGVVTALGGGTTKINATMLPYDVTSSITLTVPGQASGGGGGSSYISTSTVKNEDGSTTKITTNKRTGEVTSTTSYTDGTVITVKEKKDGSSTCEETRNDGTTVKTTTNAEGVSTAEIGTSKEVSVNVPVDNPEDVLVVILTDENGKASYITDAKVSEKGVEVNTNKSVSVSFICGERKVFDDVHSVNHWSQKAVDFVSALGIMKGTAEKEFSPDDMLTRAMMVTVLYRQAGEPEVKGETKFTDVEKGSYYEKAVIWASENKIVNGISETSFAPDEFISREQSAAMLYRYAEYKDNINSEHGDTNLLSYDDFDEISEWAISSMQWANGAGIINGRSSTSLAPLGNLTRAEAAQILLNYMQY